LEQRDGTRRGWDAPHARVFEVADYLHIGNRELSRARESHRVDRPSPMRFIRT